MLRAAGRVALVALAAAALASGCGDDVQQANTTGAPSGSGAGSTAGAGGQGGSGADGGAGAQGGGAGAQGGGSGANGPMGTCFDEPPAGAEVAPPLPSYGGGTCPTLQPGTNTIATAGGDREFILILPSDLSVDESLPLAFLWHWLGGDASDFIDQGDVQAAADTYRFAAIAPEAKGDVQFTWPMDALSSDARAEEELTFFDDMLACAAEQLNINPNCVASTGVSAGALFTDAVLAGGRGQHLSSIVSLSGGVGGPAIKPWSDSAHNMPAIVLWGGPTDNCLGLLSFETLSLTLEQELEDDGHFMLECIHNCGHSAPPFDVPAGQTPFSMMWEFMIDHPYWLNDGDSPYLNGLPPNMPDWCAVGPGSATPREGACDNPSGC